MSGLWPGKGRSSCSCQALPPLSIPRATSAPQPPASGHCSGASTRNWDALTPPRRPRTPCSCAPASWVTPTSDACSTGCARPAPSSRSNVRRSSTSRPASVAVPWPRPRQPCAGVPRWCSRPRSSTAGSSATRTSSSAVKREPTEARPMKSTTRSWRAGRRSRRCCSWPRTATSCSGWASRSVRTCTCYWATGARVRIGCGTSCRSTAPGGPDSSGWSTSASPTLHRPRGVTLDTPPAAGVTCARSRCCSTGMCSWSRTCGSVNGPGCAPRGCARSMTSPRGTRPSPACPTPPWRPCRGRPGYRSPRGAPAGR